MKFFVESLITSPLGTLTKGQVFMACYDTPSQYKVYDFKGLTFIWDKRNFKKIDNLTKLERVIYGIDDKEGS